MYKVQQYLVRRYRVFPKVESKVADIIFFVIFNLLNVANFPPASYKYDQ